MRWDLLLTALAMPVVAWLSQLGWFGPDNKTVSDAYPTLLVAAGYAFSIWSVIFVLNLALAAAQWRRPAAQQLPGRVAAALSAVYVLNSAWMVLFPQRAFVAALVLLWASLALLLYAVAKLARGTDTLARWAVGLHAGWVSLAAVLNTAQVLVAYRWVPPWDQFPASVALWVLAAVIVLGANARLRGHPAYGLAALWGLAGVAVMQLGQNALPGAQASGFIALGLAALLAGQMGLLRWRSGRM